MTPGFQNNPQHYIRTPRTSETPAERAYAGVKCRTGERHISMVWHELVLALIGAAVAGGFVGAMLF